MAGALDKFKAWVKKPRGLLAMAEAGDTAGVLDLLDRGCDTEQSWQGTTAIMMAAIGGHAPTVQALLNRGANINPAFLWDWDSFAYAVMGGSLEVVQIFLKRGADINAKDPEHEITSLMRAAERGSVDIVKLLLDLGMDVNACDSEEKTALTYARRYHRPDVMQLLTQRGGRETAGWLGIP